MLMPRSTFNAFGEINKGTVFRSRLQSLPAHCESWVSHAATLIHRMNDQPQPEKVKSCLDASLKKDLKAGRSPQWLQWLPTPPLVLCRGPSGRCTRSGTRATAPQTSSQPSRWGRREKFRKLLKGQPSGGSSSVQAGCQADGGPRAHQAGMAEGGQTTQRADDADNNFAGRGGELADWPCARAGYSGCPEPLAAGCYGPELT